MDVIHAFSDLVRDPDGDYLARVIGQPTDSGTWEGYIELVPLERGRAVLRTGRETTQPNRTDLEYWATGLEPVYLEGALDRARRGTGSSEPPGRGPPRIRRWWTNVWR